MSTPPREPPAVPLPRRLLRQTYAERARRCAPDAGDRPDPADPQTAEQAQDHGRDER